MFDELNALSSDDDEGFFRPGALNLPIPESLKGARESSCFSDTVARCVFSRTQSRAWVRAGSDFEKMINFFKDNAEEMEELFKLPKNNPRSAAPPPPNLFISFLLLLLLSTAQPLVSLSTTPVHTLKRPPSTHSASQAPRSKIVHALHHMRRSIRAR